MWEEKKTRAKNSSGSRKRGLREARFEEEVNPDLFNLATIPFKLAMSIEKEEVGRSTRRQLDISTSRKVVANRTPQYNSPRDKKKMKWLEEKSSKTMQENQHVEFDKEDCLH